MVDRFRPLFFSVALVALIMVAWSNSLTAPFELDDDSSIRDNATIRHLTDFAWLRPPSTRGETVSGRPVLNLSFAADQAVGGFDVRVYHAVNLLVHACAALLLFGVVRRTFELRRSTTPIAGVEMAARRAGPNVAAGSSAAVAFIIAAVWALHPLQTESVTYIVQRAESLMGLFYLLTLYAFVRGVAAGESVAYVDRAFAVACGGGRTISAVWQVISVGACALGMATKEDMVFAPVVVLLFDRTFVSGTFRAAIRRRLRYYIALGATWLWLGLLVVANGGRGGSAGFGTSIGFVAYALTQAQAWWHYLRLVVWPSGLVFDYGTPTVATLWAVLPQVIALGAAVTVIGRAVVRNHPAGLLGASACLALAPSSSIVPVATQTMAEHRVYLALAPLIVLGVIGLSTLGTPRGRAILATLAIGALGTTTFLRNATYASAVALWSDTVAKAPGNPRAYNNLGLALRDANQTDAAITAFKRAIVLQPNHAFAHNNLGALLLTRRDWQGAADHFSAAVADAPDFTDARVNWGVALTQLGRCDEAITQYRAALREAPHAADVESNLASLLVDAGNVAEAESLVRDALTHAPDSAAAHLQSGRILERNGGNGAEAEYRTVLRLKPDWAAPRLALGNLLAGQRQYADAEACYRDAIRLDPNSAEARYALGDALAHQQKFGAAIEEFSGALRLDPDHWEARANRGNCELVTGRIRDAIADYEYVLRQRPQDARVAQNLALGRQMLSDQSP